MPELNVDILNLRGIFIRGYLAREAKAKEDGFLDTTIRFQAARIKELESQVDQLQREASFPPQDY